MNFVQLRLWYVCLDSDILIQMVTQDALKAESPHGCDSYQGQIRRRASRGTGPVVETRFIKFTVLVFCGSWTVAMDTAVALHFPPEVSGYSRARGRGCPMILTRHSKV